MLRLFSYDFPLQVVTFVLNDLGRKILKGFYAGLEGLVPVADFDLFVAGGLPGALQGEAALF